MHLSKDIKDTSNPWNYYSFSGNFSIAIYNGYIPSGLSDFLKSQKLDHSIKPNLEIVICRRKHQLPSNASVHYSDIYKGIPWTLKILKNTEDNTERCFFYSFAFTTFLILRTVIIPHLKQEIIKEKGFSILGSSFEFEKTIFVLFAKPGSGKTRLLLEAIDKGAKFLGDNELMITKDGEVKSLFNDTEFRLSTVQGTSFWKNLSRKQKAKLFLYHVISFLTFRLISFNISIPALKTKLTEDDSKNKKRIIFINLSNDDSKQLITPSIVWEHILDYECSYRKLFKNPFFTEKNIHQSEDIIKNILSTALLWDMPTKSTLNEILRIGKS